ncbi:uncharacterized protein BCR38DRAFT_408361 [Pseudomassariella vexata]|uniref:HCP-like protein n=1 Tax=Pseudomassariella vexata TaxID=1141098 RepID=A0A1Y2E4D5_9PEZI|nr:uncharacterized protein BCR38DRAFT_408361 [Pseudomassariella vexata]ORY66420.1 hypothetical protein BCR38DRAFT_408361 [Pseudomassariella vexata]
MAAVTTTPPPNQSSPPRSVKRIPLSAPDLSPERYRGHESNEHTSPKRLVTGTMAEARMGNAPVSPVRLSFQPENWAQPSNVNIEGSQPRGHTEREYAKSPDAPPPLPPPHGSTYMLDSRQPPSSVQQSSGEPLPPPTFTVDLPHRTGEDQHSSPAVVQMNSGMRHMTERGEGAATPEKDSQSYSKTLHGHDPNRHSRDTNTSSSTQQQTSTTESSTETNASSVSQDACESTLLSERTSQEDSFTEPGFPEGQSVPQLHYHHQAAVPRVSSAPLEANARNASNPDLAEEGTAINRHLTPNSYGRRSSMPRPPSAYSLHSELESRGRSPHGRTPSSQARRSPETRPISYAELLNVPYPQPAPAPITFDNSQLRNNVGTNAALLSAQKTLEMYRQNVKKTNDVSIQYSFAVFLISTAQEQGFTPEEPARSKVTKNGIDEGNPYRDSKESSPAALVREAKTILTRLANGGYPFAQYYLADGYASGLFNKGKEDYNAAFPLFVLAAKHGHAESGYRAGLCYEFGWGCRKDPAKAVQFLRTAASKSHPGAMTRLGKACLSGDLGENRYREGLKWLKRATETADNIYNAAPYHLGALYETGYGEDIFKDEGYAAELFTQAAELGHPEANFRMGDAYEHGKLNCPRDPALSVHFYTGAAERGHPAAMMGLCAWYLVGAEPVLEKDEEEAYEWARRSADLDYVKAQYAVGYFTEMGIGCRRDILEANVWYVKAADAGDERAKQRLAAIRAAVSGGTPMEVAPPRNAKMKKAQHNKEDKDEKECVVM